VHFLPDELVDLVRLFDRLVRIKFLSGLMVEPIDFIAANARVILPDICAGGILVNRLAGTDRMSVQSFFPPLNFGSSPSLQKSKF